MPEYALVVTRAGGQLQPLKIIDPGFDAVCRQALRFARNAAVHGCPVGDAQPPRWVDILDAGGALILRIAVDDSLKPIGERA